MKRTIIALAATAALVLAIGGAAAWNKYLRTPAPNRFRCRHT